MKVLLSNKLSIALINSGKEVSSQFIRDVEELEKMSREEILDSNSVMLLESRDGIDLYVFYAGDSRYYLFAFKNKRTIVVMDAMELKDKKLKSIAYSELTN